MADLNKLFLMGRLTHDPELRNLSSGTAVCDLGLATSRQWRDKSGQEKEDKLFVDVTVWGKTAENCARYLAKGSPVHVEGYLKLESWEDKKTGEKRSKIKVEAERVQFLGGKPAERADNFVPPPAREPEPWRHPGPATTPGREPVTTPNGTRRYNEGSSNDPCDEADIPF